METFVKKGIRKFASRFPARVFSKMWGIVEDDISEPAKTVHRKNCSKTTKCKHEKHLTENNLQSQDEKFEKNYYLDNLT